MLKSALIIILSILSGEIFSQDCSICKSNLFAGYFLYFPLKPVDPLVFHYTKEDYYKPDNRPKKRTEDYRYMHNGDNFKGTMDILNDDMEPGSGWLKNFDFGKFASVIIEVKGDNRNGSRGVFKESGKLIFVKLHNK